MRISVCIPAFNEIDHLPRCIESVRESFKSRNESDYEIVVCDNNSTDGTGEVARNLGAHVVFEPHNQIARARNAAGGEAKGEWLIFIDADSLLTPVLLVATLESIANPKSCGGGATISFDTPNITAFLNRGVSIWNAVSRWLNWAAGSYVFCLRIAWKETGGFGEEFYAAEEIEFSRRLKRWARKNKKQFRILPKAQIVTSARKIEIYSEGELKRVFWNLIRQGWGGLRNRENCAIWYERRKPK